MIPNNTLSSSPVPAAFYGGRNNIVTRTKDYEDGGIAIQDPSQGLLYQVWTATLLNPGTAGSTVRVSAPTVPEFTMYQAPNITEISFSFDQSMRPVLAFVQNGTAKLWWYDSTIASQTVTDIGTGVVTPRVAMDDKRKLASNDYALSDVILAYIKNRNLYYRQQRDRYTIEYLLDTDVANGLIKIGFGVNLRMQFMLEEA